MLGSVVAFAALVTDVLLPLAPIALWLAIAPALLFFAVWLSMRFWPWADGLGKRMVETSGQGRDAHAARQFSCWCSLT